MPSAITPNPRRAACVVCGKPVTPEATPFCSQGCRDRDLLQWLSDGHRIAGPPADDEDAGGSAPHGVDTGDDGT